MRTYAFAFLAVAAVTLWLIGPVYAAPILVDGFEPGISGSVWQKGPAGWSGAQFQEDLKGDDSHIRTPGVNAARAWVNYRVTYNSRHVFPVSYDGNIYLKCWMFEDNDIPFPGYSSEQQPNCYVTLMDTQYGMDRFSLGVYGNGGIGAFPPTNNWFYNCALYTTTGGDKVLNGTSGLPLVPRRQGWRKYSILVHPYTGSAGDVQFFIDDKLVYNGVRSSSPFGPGASLDTIVLGNGSRQEWTYETYWFDQVDFGTIETPVTCNTIADAKAQPDGAWVQLTDKVVTGRYSRSPLPGMFAIEETDRSSAIWVSSSYEAQVAAPTEEGELLSVKGIMYTNGAGVRYLDAIEITGVKSLAQQAGIVATPLKNLDDPNIPGMLVKVWGKVTGKGQERRGDWRRYILIDDGSTNAPVKCYYDNIISGIDPVPNVANNDYVSVVGVAGKDVLVPGGPAEDSVWIRKAGDLAIQQPAP